MLVLKPVLYCTFTVWVLTIYLFSHSIFGAQLQEFWENGAPWSPLRGCTIPAFRFGFQSLDLKDRGPDSYGLGPSPSELSYLHQTWQYFLATFSLSGLLQGNVVFIQTLFKFIRFHDIN